VHSTKRSARIIMAALRSAGIRDLVVSPGSRNAPLIIEALAAGYKPEVIVDERSAGFTALGMAQQSGMPAVLICTSGTAVLNYHPAVAEAFYARIPLIVISADRPPYRIDKGEGQTIRQHEVLKNHTHYSVSLPLDGDGDETEAWVAQAVQTAFTHQGPVHINVPFEEPLYEQTDINENYGFDFSLRPDEPVIPDRLVDEAEQIWKMAKRKLFIVSQNRPSDTLQTQLERLAQMDDTVILTENLANVHHSSFHPHIDRLIFPFDNDEWKNYAPDLVITVGLNIISKKIKYLLRAVPPAYGHWHIGRHTVPPDTFDVLTRHWDTSPEMFLSQLLFRIYDFEPESDYKSLWDDLETYRRQKHEAFVRELPPGDMLIYKTLAQSDIPPHIFQWSNSTVVRYAQLFAFPRRHLHYANRGTSGIDGSLSTAAGAARRSGKPVLHVSGDLSFQYDNNGLWPGLPDNLKIITINNGGGDIFRFIPGPSQVPGYEKYFVYRHQKDFSNLAAHYGLNYRKLTARPGDTPEPFAENISAFLHDPETRILEIDTSATDNAGILKQYFHFLK